MTKILTNLLLFACPKPKENKCLELHKKAKNKDLHINNNNNSLCNQCLNQISNINSLEIILSQDNNKYLINKIIITNKETFLLDLEE